MGLRPTTKKVNGRWYDINQAADRIAELEQQVEALEAARFAYASEFDGDKESIHENIRKMKQQVEALTDGVEELLKKYEALNPDIPLVGVFLKLNKALATAQQEGGE